MLKDWLVESGEYSILIGASSRDLRLKDKVMVKSTVDIPIKYHINSIVGDIIKNPAKAEILKDYMAAMEKVFSEDSDGEKSEGAKEELSDEMKEAIYNNMPLRNFVNFGGGTITYEQIEEVINKLNE